MYFLRFASVNENVAACKTKPTSNIIDIIIIPFYCLGMGVVGQCSFEDLTLNISGKIVLSNILQTFYTSQENGNFQTHNIRTVSSEPSVFAQTEELENPKHLRWLQMHFSPITDRTVQRFTMFCTLYSKVPGSVKIMVHTPSICEVKITMTATYN